MTMLLMGVILFFSIHAVPATPIKPWMITRMGEGPYKGLFSLLSAIGLTLLIMGKGSASFIEVWQPPTWGRHVAMLGMMLALFLLAVYLIPSNVRKLIRHPMMLSVGLWSVSHLLANGDLASIILFGSFGVFAIIHIVMVTRRSATTIAAPNVAKDVSHLLDGAVIIAAGLLYAVIFMFHRQITGVPLL